MNSGWPETRLDELTELIVDCPHSTPKWTNEGITVLRSNNIKNGRLDLSNPSYTNETGYLERIKRATPESGDLVFTREAPMGEVCKIPENFKCCLGQRMVLLRVKKELMDSSYLLFALQSPYLQYQISWNEGTGTTVSNIRMPNIKAFKIPTPPLKEQKAIAHILGSLDDKIELNRQMNETLEAMAQALFKSWFMDFDPVIDNALAAGNAIPEVFAERAEQRKAVKKGEAINPLFPDAFEYKEEMGWIPEGWRVTELSNLISIKHGFAFKGEFFSQEKTQDILLTPGNFTIGGGFKGNKFKYYSGPIPEDYILSKNDLLVTMTDLSKAGDTLGYPLFVPETTGTRYLHNQRLGKVEITESCIGKEFLYRCMCSKSYRDNVLSNVSGSTVKHTSPTKIMTHQLTYSGGKVEELFEEQCKELSAKSQINDLNTQTLSKLRDTLLPKLLSGELRIPDAEKLIEEAQV